MDENAELRHVFWRAGCVTKGACPVREEATRDRPPNGGATLVAYFHRHIGADRQQVMTLGVDEFIRRFLLHVLSRGFHRIRHYGLLASSAHKASLARARELLAVVPPSDDDVPEEPLDARPPCPCCGGHMIIIETFGRWRLPRAPPHCTPPTGRNSP